MRRRPLPSARSILLLSAVLLAGCGDKDDSGAAASGDGACDTMCLDAGFGGGVETGFGGGVVECQCDGSGDGISQGECTAHCAPFGVAADRSYLTTEFNPDDKCVCDGTE